MKVKSLSRVGLFSTPGTAAYQAPLSMGFSRQEYWSGVPLPFLHSEIYIGLLQMDEKVNLCSFVIPAIRNEGRSGNASFLKIHGSLLVGRISLKFKRFSLKNVSF